MHAAIHMVDGPKIDKIEDSEVVQFINMYLTCASPFVTEYREMSNLVKKAQTCHHTVTCRKKKGVARRSNAPWTPSDKIEIVCSEDKINETMVKQNNKRTGKVYKLQYLICLLSHNQKF